MPGRVSPSPSLPKNSAPYFIIRSAEGGFANGIKIFSQLSYFWVCPRNISSYPQFEQSLFLEYLHTCKNVPKTALKNFPYL